VNAVPESEAHFERIKPLKAFERRLLKRLVQRDDYLSSEDEALVRYALNMARIGPFEGPDGREWHLSDCVDELRSWMIDHVVPTIPEHGAENLDALLRQRDALASRLDVARDQLLDAVGAAFGPDYLDEEMRQKSLALVLGGGGGSGLFHLATFAALEELGVTPDFIVGSSMGSVLGLLRSLDREYNPLTAALALPRELDYEHVFRPYTGGSRYGFPGAYHLNITRLARQIFEAFFDKPDIRFDDLAIPLEVVTCGVTRGFEFDESDTALSEHDEIDEPVSLGAIRRNTKRLFGAARRLISDSNLMRRIPFGREETRQFPVIEAVGFSCAVPGFLNFDIFHDDPATIEPLEEIFEREGLLRLCDGGIVSNVPSKTAWESIHRGTIGSRNTWIASFDVFAPVPRRRNVVWLPIQQLIRPNVLAERPYSDFHKTFRQPPDPTRVLMNSYSEIRKVLNAGREELEEDMALMARALHKLPPYGVWQDD
jgi:predicted acylesterase/phospholipase RssA